MDFTDLLISLALVLLVLRQLQARPLTYTNLLWPLPLVLYAAFTNLHALPIGSDLNLSLSLGVIGLILGVLCGRFTQVYLQEDTTFAKATGIAALLWVIGIGARVAFALYAVHGGGPAIARLSAEYHFTAAAYTAGLLLMSLLEVLGRSATLMWRKAQLQRLHE